MNLTHLSTFTGIGGIDLAAEWAEFETVGQVEWGEYQTKILEKYWPDIPRWRDIRDVTIESIRKQGIKENGITLLSGGFPCQPHALQENVKGLMMNVICGGNLQESLAKLNPDGSWAKMYQDYFQVKMDGSLEEYSGTWPKWGTMSDGVLT